MLRCSGIWVPSVLVVGLLAVTCGCAGKAYDKADKAISSMEAVQTEIASGKEQVRKVIESIDGFKAGTDLKAAYDQFESAVKSLDSSVERIRSRADAMKANADEYYAAWSKNLEKVQDPELRKSLEERRAGAKKLYDELSAAVDEARAAYEPFTQDLEELKTVLPLDLTPNGIEVLAGKFESTKAHGETVIEKVDVVVDKIQEIQDASASAPQTGGEAE